MQNSCIHNDRFHEERIESQAFEQSVFGEHIPWLSRYLHGSFVRCNGITTSGQTADGTPSEDFVYSQPFVAVFGKVALPEKHNDRRTIGTEITGFRCYLA